VLGLWFVHSFGLIHGWITTKNILLDSNDWFFELVVRKWTFWPFKRRMGSGDGCPRICAGSAWNPCRRGQRHFEL
jgi:hypothetical protein